MFDDRDHGLCQIHWRYCELAAHESGSAESAFERTLARAADELPGEAAAIAAYRHEHAKAAAEYARYRAFAASVRGALNAAEGAGVRPSVVLAVIRAELTRLDAEGGAS